MPQGPDGNTIIIVKKVSGHAGAHGGAWKVAYADFVTSMMALFMVLWLVNTSSVITRERIASYFKQPGIFEKGSGTPLELGESGILKENFSPPTSGNSQVYPDKSIYSIEANRGLRTEGVSGGDKNLLNKPLDAKEQAELENIQKQEFERVAEELKESLGGEGDKAGAIGEFSVKVDEIGLHLEIMDTPTASMFALGSDTILPEAQQQLKKIAELLKQLPNPVEIEGHTDARPFKSAGANGKDNWSLSASRANAARRVLEQAGVTERQILSVIGYADRKLKIEENPLADSNRRISISMRYSNEAAQALKERPGISRKDLKKEEPKGTPKVEETEPKEGSKSSTSIEASAKSSSAEAAVIEASQFKDFGKNNISSASSSSVSSLAGSEVNSSSEAPKVNEKLDKPEVKVETKTSGKAEKIEKQPLESKVVNGKEPKTVENKKTSEPQVIQTPTEKPAVLADPKKPLWQQKNFIFGNNNPFDK